ncbi:hypothetical protein GCM10011609_87590 [Lentzea pudingi]|uniref:Tn3 transposase DDE domain-containing protein n=1 Tax=Lentzea pudingi TaxID=1789439 RepID=A0ABQ2IUI7_9PSEU|nr:Tn3 family transposase [Lentzea pudingi]GGN30061.1 hypothetical protein GCM10011609_87590 [Lentzea pudingi]
MDGKVKVYGPGDNPPIEGVVPKAWRDGVTDENGQVERISYELCADHTAGALRRQEIWVVGAGRWRDPEEDLPSNFEDNRDVHYAALGKLLQAQEFVEDLKRRSAIEVVFYGKDGKLTGADQENVSMLALHLLQSCLIYINTLLLQRVLDDPVWTKKLTPEDRRGLNALFWTNVNPYGRFQLNMDTRLDLDLVG